MATGLSYLGSFSRTGLLVACALLIFAAVAVPGMAQTQTADSHHIYRPVFIRGCYRRIPVGGTDRRL